MRHFPKWKIAGIGIVMSHDERAGIRVCEAMARRGVLTRPISNVIALMPPYCTTPKQAAKMVSVLHDAVAEVFRAG